MALQLSYTTTSGITVPTAYAHIASWTGNKFNINLQIVIWKDAASETAKLQPLAQIPIRLALPNGATMAQMYTALKLQAPFIGATDC